LQTDCTDVIIFDSLFLGAGAAHINLPLQQLRCTEAIEALHAVHFGNFDARLLTGQPVLAASFHAAIEGAPNLSARLTGYAVWAKLCHAELDPGQQWLKNAGNPGNVRAYCNIAAASGVFEQAYDAITEALQVSSPSVAFCSAVAGRGVSFVHASAVCTSIDACTLWIIWSLMTLVVGVLVHLPGMAF